MYISPRATKVDEQKILAQMTKMSRGQSVVQRYLNGRHRTWKKTKMVEESD